MAKKKVLYVNQEIAPYVPESEMSIIGGELPNKIQEKGFEIRTFMPKWSNINERRRQLHEVARLSGMNLIIDETDHPLIIKVASIPSSHIQVYFIDNEDYFLTQQAAGDDGNDTAEYPDDGERAIFFARGVLETVKKLRWTPDIIHCQGWITSVVPLYVKTAFHDDPSFANAKVVTSLFRDPFKNRLGTNFKRCLEFRDTKADLLTAYAEDFDFTELTKMAIDYSDAVVEAGKDVNADLLKYAEDKGRRLLRYPADDYVQAYTDLYNEISQ